MLYQPMNLPGDISLRPMRAEDEAVFRRLYAEVRAAELSAIDWPDAQKQAFCDSQYGLQDQHYRQYYADFEPWAICHHEEAKGVGTVIGRLYLATFEDLLILMDITLAGTMRGKGIGTMLLQDLVCQADARRQQMRLHVETYNPARRLYERLGFVKIADGELYQEMRREPHSSSQA